MHFEDVLFEKGGSSLVSLYGDNDTRHLVQRHIATHLMSSDAIVNDRPFDQCICLLSQANFADSETECAAVARSLLMVVSKPDVLPLCTEHRGLDLAARCLISLGLFLKALEERERRRGAPSAGFYRTVGEKEYNVCGMDDVACHFRKWEGFLGEMFST